MSEKTQTVKTLLGCVDGWFGFTGIELEAARDLEVDGARIVRDGRDETWAVVYGLDGFGIGSGCGIGVSATVYTGDGLEEERD